MRRKPHGICICLGVPVIIRLDLITGFLGAGKTTFLLRYADYLLRHGEKLGILVYDHGALNVDLPLLSALRSDRCELETLAGGCDADCHRRRFRTRLIAMSMAGYDRVIIEPSGVFDMDEFFDTIHEPPLDSKYEPGSVIAVVDAKLEEKLSPEEDFFLASQAADAGAILLSRCQMSSPEEIEGCLAHLERAAAMIRCRKALRPKVIAKDWDTLTDADFAALADCGCSSADYVKTIAGSDGGFQSLPFLNLSLNPAALREKTRALFHDARFGRVLRVKGITADDGRFWQFNATPDSFRSEPADNGRPALLVIGVNLNEDEINLLLTGTKPEHHIL